MARTVVVIGAGQGGLSAAIHARLRGYEVLVVERKPAEGGKATATVREGFRLDLGPSIVILPRIYEDVFRAAGRKMEDYLTFERLDPISQVRFLGEVVNLPAGRDAAVKLLEQLEPGDGRALETLFAKLDRVLPHVNASVFRHGYDRAWQLADPHLIAVGMPFDVRKSYRELIDGWFHSPLVRAFFYGFPSYGGQTYDSKAPGALLIPYLMLQEGVFYPKGGISAIPTAFRRLAEELGVAFRFGEEVTGVDAGSERVKAVLLGSGERLAADAFIANVDPLTFGQNLGRTATARPSLSYFTLHWGLKTRPKGLGHHTLVIPEDFDRGFTSLYRERKFPQPPIVYLNETSAIDPTTAPNGGGNLFAVVTAPSRESHIDWARDLDRYADLTRRTMREEGIDFDPCEVVFEHRQSPLTFESRDGNYLGSLYGVDESARPFGGLFPTPNSDPQFTNLVYCGGAVQPGAGLPMVTLSGRFAADRLPR